MPITYHVTINDTGKAHTQGQASNRYRVTWMDAGGNKINSFEQSPEITGEDTRRLSRMPQFQLGIGQKIFRFLDGQARNFRQALEKAHRKGDILRLYLHTCKQTHDWPFELLAQDGTFLLPRRLHLIRSVSDRGAEKDMPPKDRPLKLLFMACSPIDVKPVLDFEREEDAIFEITRDLPIDMDVEDSGSLEGLRTRLEQEQYDVVHLSGHADIDRSGRPYFLMEDEIGRAHRVFPDELWNEALSENPPRLLFLSGCRTGETPVKDDDAGDKAEGSFARLLVENHHVPAVLGWGRSVNDREATHAGKMIFHDLSRGKPILQAVQRARYELMTDFPGIDKPAWPMLRLFGSDIPLNAMVKENQPWQPKLRVMKYVQLDGSRVKVLAEGFVGRRRQIQTALRVLKHDAGKVGVMLLGTGGLGKSCLAGKLCERFPEHTLIIVHGRFNAITLQAALDYAFVKAQDEKGRQVLSQKIEMKDKLANLCTTVFKEKNYLILLDDFEQNLEGSDKGQPGPLLPETEQLLDALLHYLPPGGKMTQMIITCRYEFSYTARDRNPVEERLENVWLTGFRKAEQSKKARALKNIANYPDSAQTAHLLAAGHGNPRLMEWIDVLVGQMESAEVPQLLEAVKDKQEDFIQEHVIRELLQLGGKELELFLRRFSIYRQPVLRDGVRMVSKKAGLSGWRELLRKGMALSLTEHDQVHRCYQVTPLLREELLKKLDDRHACHEAAFAYYRKVCEASDAMDAILTEEWIFHALGCGEEDVASEQGGYLINYFGDGLAYLEARRVGKWILAEINAKNRELSTGNDAFLLNALGYTLHYLGDNVKANEYYQQALDIDEAIFGQKHPRVATVLNNLGAAWKALGESRKAIDYYQQALDIDEAIFGQKHHNVARELNNLGSAWADLGEHRKAIDYCQQSLNINEAIFGQKHPNVAVGLNNLGAAWKDLGKPRKAIDYYQQALDIRKEVYGETHPDVAISLNNLGSAWLALGEHRKAIDYYQQALEIWTDVYGETHPKVATVLNNLGAAWQALGEHRKAIDYLHQALDIDEEVFGPNHPDVARDLNNLGKTWNDLGDHRKSIEYLQQALDIWKEAYGERHPQVAAALNNLGLAWKSLGEHRKAIDYYRQALDIAAAVFGEKHPNVALGLNNLGMAWCEQEDYSQAFDYFEQAYAILQAVHGSEHPDTSTVLNNLEMAREALRACQETH